MRYLIIIIALVVLATFSWLVVRAQYVHVVTGTAVTLVCTNTTGTNYATDVYTETLTANTIFTLPASAINCVNRSHIELFITQGTNQAFSASVSRGTGTVLAFPAAPNAPLTATTTSGAAGILQLPTSTGGATDITLHEIWIYDTHPTTPEWKLVTQEINPPGGQPLNPCQFPGATADAQINNAYAALPAGGTIDARCYGSTTQTIAAPVIWSSGTRPTALLIDSATNFNCTITGGASSCWNVGANGSLNAYPGGVNASAVGLNLAAGANVQSVVTNVPLSISMVVAGIFIPPSTGTVGKGALWLNAPLQPVVLNNINIGGIANANLLYIGNEAGQAIGPISGYDVEADCNGKAGCHPVKIGPPTTTNYFGGFHFFNMLANHPGAGGIPCVEIDDDAVHGQPSDISFKGLLVEGFQAADIGLLISGGIDILADHVVSSDSGGSAGTTVVKLVGGNGGNFNISLNNIDNTGGAWPNTIVNTQASGTYTNTLFNVPHYYFHGTNQAQTVLNDGANDVTNIAAGYVQLKPEALANFPVCAAGTEGSMGTQTNSTAACSAGTTATNAGTTHCQIYCNGTNWIQTGR